MAEPLGSCAQIVTPVETIEVKALSESKVCNSSMWQVPTIGVATRHRNDVPIFPAAKVDRAAREVCALLMPTFQL